MRLVEGRPQHASELFPLVLRRLVRGTWRSWQARNAEMESRRAA